jgi:hypothetical protein
MCSGAYATVADDKNAQAKLLGHFFGRHPMRIQACNALFFKGKLNRKLLWRKMVSRFFLPLYNARHRDI